MTGTNGLMMFRVSRLECCCRKTVVGRIAEAIEGDRLVTVFTCTCMEHPSLFGEEVIG